MEEILNSIKAYLYDRVSSPLIGAYVISWCLWNYRFWIILFSGNDRTIEAVFEQIDSVFSPIVVFAWDSIEINGKLFHGVLMPAIISLLYIYAYPWLSKPVYEHSLRKQKELRELKQQAENNRLLSVEESRVIYRRLSELQTKHNEEIDIYDKQIESLNSKIKELEAQLASEASQADRLRETPFDDINVAEPEEFDKALDDSVSSLKSGEFQLSDLFEKNQWASLNSTLKQAIGKRFKEKVSRGDYIGVSIERKGTGNQQIYKKK